MEIVRKIMFFSNSIGIGGVESVFCTYANALSEKHKVIYVFCKGHSKFDDRFSSKVKLINLNVQKFRKSFFKLIKVLNKEKPDILITGNDFGNIFNIFACKLSFAKTKSLISQHNYLNLEYNSFLHKLCFKIYGLADGIISVSKGITSFISEFTGVRKNIETLYNPIDIDLIQSLAEKSVDENINKFEEAIVFIGRISPVKNLTFLIRTFELVKNSYPKLVLFIIGDGPELNNIQELVSELGLVDSVIFTGSKQNPYPYIKKSKAVILSSLSEALPTVILEAFALAKTVVSTPTNGAVDLLKNGKLGYLTSSFSDCNEFRSKIIDSLECPIPPKVLLKEAENFKKEIRVEELSRVINNVIDGKK